MTIAAIWGIFKVIGSFVGILITLITFFTLISKKPRAAFRKVIREESQAANKGIEDRIKSIEGDLKEAKENDIAIIRNTITHIYFKYKDQKKIPHYEKENILSLWERYQKLGGNHYVENVIHEVEGWEEII